MQWSPRLRRNVVNAERRDWISVESGAPAWGGHQETLGGHTLEGRGLLPTEAELEGIHRVALRVLDEIG
jgi:hypothetical protein